MEKTLKESKKIELMNPTLSDNATYIAETRYAMKNEEGKTIEKVKDIFWRVAVSVAKGDEKFRARNGKQDVGFDEDKAWVFYNLMAEQKFFPNTPCLVNAGKEHQQLSACFVLPIEDSMKGILKTMSDMALIHKSGGGTGFSFSRLRPYGDYIKTSGGTTVGPISFMQAYNDVTSQIKQGGVRRGANMGMLAVDHPDVLRFAVVKLDEYCLTNFNISLAVTNEFMNKIDEDKKFCENDAIPEEVVEEIRAAEANRDVDARLRQIEEGVKKLYAWASAKQVDEGEGYELINPRNGEVMGKLNAYKVFNLVTRLAWQYGDPGLVFIDRMNDEKSNPVPKLGRIEATNPCGEQPLLPYDACNLGSINLAKFVLRQAQDKLDLDWRELERVVRESIHFLDNVVEINEFPVDEIREMVTKTRRIGLGVMGFADMLFKLGVRYDSDEGVAWAKKVMKFIDGCARGATVDLAKKRGVFDAWNISVYAGTDYRPRNMALTTIAPTGTISMIADSSSGIEPVFSLGYQKNTVEGKTLYLMNPVFKEDLEKRGLYSDELMDKVVKNGGKLEGITELPDDVKNIYRTALEIEPEWHVKIQAAFQEYIDNAVSKTINFPKEASVENVRDAYRLAYSLGTKGITIYRSGSREKEVIAPVKEKNNGKSELTREEMLMMLKNEKPKKKATPEAARGVRVRKPCDMGKVYTSVFFEAGDGPVEVFVNLGKSGGYMTGAAEVTGRLASLSLKYGATLEEVASELVGIFCGQKVGFGTGTILSMFDAVGKSLLEVSRGEQLDLFSNAQERTHSDVPIQTAPVQTALAEIRTEIAVAESKFSSCPDCGSPLYAEEGCFKCSNAYCGYSKCS
ncbi:ribonucleoside-diphosphate reductase, adenosylcobalamin-dependent [Candidatus Shapirobacteria bacterium RIFOXYD1_FULL_38_32]|uniref:Vitamin B12-dependent ribonucleotide reductase n=2 Tax=Candidatus Shapironibacteriota TaxID=1752721 RepID=A0A0G0MWC1_9BACT|nr:MAG: Ribonucleoside-diphosphate reductase [Candidatus Shapirobacteria bacterium GW2011_GWE2_38_30]KKQ90287.1 MAG: Ribonucleoside-diphosphate reductase [Candidatus Shapirobacteria bacterium GW2011_GWE1_38_92]OGL55254.1 MAG: ribonucleoside-diphosphate reductase, adenosylcobalamin-dependent [Candidatus Shapirobacteria bacterium RIFOXYA1_FULL_39_17]OGL58355.1 MAG: ribonucleoside-diphosphate reductase, adenosylcobalamin-dependent [Candidatus Shapirobacteria bacterium RIFOXYD1_FULL_38_32]